MNTFNKITILALVLITFSFSTMATGLADPNSKSVKAAKVAVKNADTSDYNTLAHSAEICLLLNENVKEALTWLDQSLEIKETPYNLELKGDYLASIGKKRLARNYYFKAVLAADESYSVAQNTRIQDKIMNLR